jgi:hypothetical protein
LLRHQKNKKKQVNEKEKKTKEQKCGAQGFISTDRDKQREGESEREKRQGAIVSSTQDERVLIA